MSLFTDWDVAYGLTFEALNRKLARVFYQQRSEKHRVKQLVARVLDPQHQGLTGGFTTHVVSAGKYDPALPPSLEVSYFNEQLQQEQSTTSKVQYAPQLNAGGGLIDLVPTGSPLLPSTLFYPPGIEVRRHPSDTNTLPAVVLTGLQVGKGPLSGTGTLQATLVDWLTRPQGILNILHRHLGKSPELLPDAKLAAAKAYVSGLSSGTAVAVACGQLLNWLLQNVWDKAPFWMSDYLRPLLAKDTADVPELQALYAYAVRLRNLPTDETIRTSQDAQVLRQAIQPVYQYFFDSEAANIRRESVFKAQEALFKKDFRFATHTVVETLLSETVTTAVPQPVAQALLEAFACLVPTLMPDLAFGISNLAPAPPTAATAFVLRLGPWRLEIDRTLASNGFKITMPVLGGVYYEQASGTLQVINDRNLLAMPFTYIADFFKNTYKNPGFQILPTDLNAGSYIGVPLISEVPNPRSVTNYGSHSFSALLSSGEVTAFFSNLPPPVPPDPSRYGNGFSYSYTGFFTLLNLLAGLPQFGTGSAASMSWARVTEYRFAFLYLVTDAGEVSGQFYVLGSVNPRGSGTAAPDLKGGELSQLLEGNDSFLYIARRLLMRQVFLRNVPALFEVAEKSGVYRAATTADFALTNAGEIQNSVAVVIRYGRLKGLLRAEEQAVIAKSLQLADDAAFTIPAQGFTFGAKDDKLSVAIAQVSYLDVVGLSNLQISFSYVFRNQNGVQRYTLEATQVSPTVTLKPGLLVSLVGDWGNTVLIGTVFVGTTIWAGWNWYRGGELRQVVPARAQLAGQAPDLVQLLQEIPPTQPEPMVQLSAQTFNGMPEGDFSEADITAESQREHFNPVRRPVIQPLQGEFFPKYSKYVYKQLKISDLDKAPIAIYDQKPLEIQDLTYRHRYSLLLTKVSRRKSLTLLKFRLTDWRYNGEDDAPLQDVRQVALTYSYRDDNISTLVPCNTSLDKKSKTPEAANRDLLEALIGPRQPEEPRLYSMTGRNLLTSEFSQDIQRVLLETTYLRHQQDQRGKAFLRATAYNVFTAVWPPAAVLVTAFLASRKAADEDPIKSLLGNRFINLFLERQLNAVKYPYEEHFTVNAVSIDQDGLKVAMGPLTATMLTFQAGTTEQHVSTYVNVREVSSIGLSVDGLLDQNKLADYFGKDKIPQVDILFDIGFGYESTAEENGRYVTSYRDVGKRVSFSLQARKTADGISLKLSISELKIADFQSVEQANTLVVRRLTAAFQTEEVNALTVSIR